MSFTSTPVTIKNAANADQSMIAYNDGTSSALAHPLLDNTGAIINPATADKQPALDNARMPVVPAMSSAGHVAAVTAATGSNWTAFGNNACKQLSVSNQTGTSLEFRQGGSGTGFPVPSGMFFTFYGLTNSNNLEVRRVDTLGTQVTINARWEN